MKNLFFAFIGILFLMTANAQVQLGWKSHDLNGKIETLKSKPHYDIANIDSLVEALRDQRHISNPHFVRKFNRKGKEIEFRNYNTRTGKLRSKSFTKYDHNGNFIAHIDFDPDIIPPTDTTRYKYGVKGNKIMAVYPEGSKILYDYGPSGNLIKKTSFDRRDQLRHVRTYTYGPQGNLLVEKEVDAQGNLKSKNVLKYDENGNVIEQTKTRSDWKASRKSAFKYGDRGNVVEVGGFIDGVYHKAETIEYDDQGREIEKKRFKKDGSLSRKQVYEYDDQGNKIRSSTYTGGDLMRERTYLYDYDNKGNWVLKREFHDGEPYVVIKRELTYFND